LSSLSESETNPPARTEVFSKFEDIFFPQL
jgi:hypothetical protein